MHDSIELRNKSHKKKIEETDAKLPPVIMRTVTQAREKGASNWLSARPSAEHGFQLNKSEFRDALALRYNRDIKYLPSKCPCGQAFNVTHALNCKRGGFIAMRHNNIRDFEANLLSKVCTDVEIEPILLPTTREVLQNGTNQSNEARLDVRARGFWRRGQNAFFDVRVTNADAASQIGQSIPSILQKHEREKKRHYNQRVMDIDQGSFTPLVFTVNGSMGTECQRYHKSLAEQISSKTGESYANVISYIRCKLSFMVIRSAILCLRGSRSISKSNAAVDDDFGTLN